LAATKIINVKGTAITIIRHQDTDYISLTDMVRSFGDESIITNWLRNRNTIEFVGIWEQI
jgi:KilA-N domain